MRRSISLLKGVMKHAFAGVAVAHGAAWLAMMLGTGAAHAQTQEQEQLAKPPASPEWVARNWQTEDGLPQNTINALKSSSILSEVKIVGTTY